MAKIETRKIFVGLGNPGKAYENTYHNAGFMALDSILQSQPAGSTSLLSPRLKYKNLFEYQEVGEVVFVWPLTFMNDSGKAVREALKKFNATPEQLVVFHDDSDITIGSYKISFARNSAGHKGVQSIIDAIKTKTFERVRIGIRPARETKRQKAGEFALKSITPRDKKLFDSVFSYFEYTKVI